MAGTTANDALIGQLFDEYYKVFFGASTILNNIRELS